VTRRGEAGRGPGAEDLFAAALARHQAGLVVEAEKLYRQVLQRDSAHLGARCNIAQALHHLGKLDAAARAYLWVIARGTNSRTA
jgi:thioredoxin-like negative regulator of GroEL